MKLITVKTTPGVAGFPSKTDPYNSHDEPIHSTNRAFDARVEFAVKALRNGTDRRELIETEGGVVVRTAESYLRGEPVLPIRQFALRGSDA